MCNWWSWLPPDSCIPSINLVPPPLPSSCPSLTHGLTQNFGAPAVCSSQRPPEVSAHSGTGPTPTGAPAQGPAPTPRGAAGTKLPPALAFQKVPWESPSTEVTGRGNGERAAEEGEGDSEHFWGRDLGPDPTPGARSRE